MTENEFRIIHSKLIEYYQSIEFHLKGICADYHQDEGKDWFQCLQEYKSDPFGSLIKEIERIQKSLKYPQLTKEDIKELNSIREERNYWVHRCFGIEDNVTFSSKGELKSQRHAVRIKQALNDASTWNEKLTETGRKIRGGRTPKINL